MADTWESVKNVFLKKNSHLTSCAKTFFFSFLFFLEGGGGWLELVIFLTKIFFGGYGGKGDGGGWS